MNEKDQKRIMTETGGISGDVLRGQWSMVNGGKAVDQQITTSGDSQPHPVLPNTDFIVPAFTILNSNATASIKWGINGNANHVLLAGASITYKKKNPVLNSFVVADTGTASTIDIFG
jgi:hypothetical protein